jgi:ABC-type uncharacterized transport system involved in gliding motility auxiliary subunit
MPTAGDRRRAGAAGIVSGTVVTAVALYLAFNWLGSRHWARGDWTKAKIYSLSSTTRKVLAGLRQPVDVTVFMIRDRSRTYPEVKELLDRYRALSAQIRVEEIDPRRNPARAQALVDEYQARQNTIVFRSGSRKKHVEEDEIAEFDFSAGPGQGGGMKAFKGEQAFTSAIVAVTSSKSPRIYFASGHGEKDPSDASEAGYSEVKSLLEKDNDEVQSWASLGKSEVPKDADLVVVAGPRAAWLAPEAGALNRYLAGGGHVFVLLDPVIPRAGSARPDLGLGEILSGWGIRPQNDIVVDPGNSIPLLGAETVYVNHFGSHDIVRPLQSARMAVVLPLARSVEAASSSHAGYAPVKLLETTAEAWGETDLEHLSAVKKDSSDVPAPLALALAVSGSGATRLVFVGDSDFAANGEIANVSNANFVLNSVHWLVGSTALVGIAPKNPEQARLTLSSSAMRRIGALALLGLPGLAVAVGLFVWSRRRH